VQQGQNLKRARVANPSASGLLARPFRQNQRVFEAELSKLFGLAVCDRSLRDLLKQGI
jgi:hypothetical protein